VSMEVRHVHIRFRESVDASELGELDGVTLLAHSNGIEATLQVEGEMDNMIKTLARFPVTDLEVDRPSLEEIFLTYYESEKRE
jgi:ABC-2 type transport system ATP-binding protein